jgi:calcineurin-like phosphoesterase family protein
MNAIKQSLFSPLKFKGYDSQFLFWGCLHINHNPAWDIPLWKQRGYDSVEDHRAGLINKWNSVSTDETVGFLLGDTMFGQGGAQEFSNILDSLKFKQIFVCAGNHFAGFHQLLDQSDENGNVVIGNKVITFLPNYFELIINGQAIVCSHYPILSFNGQAKSSWMLFAHVHGNLEKSVVGKAFLDSGVRAYELSVEKNPVPKTFGELRSIMRAKIGASFDHHDSTTANPFG